MTTPKPETKTVQVAQNGNTNSGNTLTAPVTIPKAPWEGVDAHDAALPLPMQKEMK